MASDQDYGDSFTVSFARFDLDSSSLKTCQLSLLEASTGSSVTLPARGMMRSGRLFQRQMPERRTCASESSSSLPTPTACTYGTNRSPGGKVRPGLETMARRGMFAPAGGKLNPQWVQWLMGFPEGWLD